MAQAQLMVEDKQNTGDGPPGPGSLAPIFSWRLSHESWAMSLEPCAMRHEPVAILELSNKKSENT